jgi:hypothetical protein
MFAPIAHVARYGGLKMSTTIKSLMAAAALVGAMVLFSGATEERLDIRSPGVTCPAFAWPNSYSACLDDGVRPSGAIEEVEFAAADPVPVAPTVFE